MKILDLSKIESGKMELEYREVKIEEVAGDLRALFAPLAKDKGIDFVIDVQKDTIAALKTDKLRLEQVLRNLVSNALKFTKQGFVKLQIASTDSTFSFAVQDTGIGIPQKNMKLFLKHSSRQMVLPKDNSGEPGWGYLSAVSWQNCWAVKLHYKVKKVREAFLHLLFHLQKKQ